MFQDGSPLGRLIHRLARWTALAGGLVLVAIIFLVVTSVIGRALIWAGLKPVPGDYELVSIGVGFAVFGFLPWVHLTRGHATVTLLTDRFGPRVNAWILVVSDALMLAAAAFVAWRLYEGMLDKFQYRETTLLLRVPLGWAYALGLVGAVVLVIVAVFVLGRSISDAMAGRTEARATGADA